MNIANYRFIVGVIALVVCANAFVSETHSHNPQFPSYLRVAPLSTPTASAEDEQDECTDDSSDIDILQRVNEPFVCRFA